MLTDTDPYDHAKRIIDLLQSDIAEERDAGARELGALLAAVPGGWGKIVDALTAVTSAFARTRPPAPPRLADTDWKTVQGRHGHCWVRWRRNKVLLVRESGSRRGEYYPVVDGHHLSARGGPSTYGSMREAMTAAEVAADA